MQKCSGCSACVNVCPVKAISFIKNDKGFYAAKIDNEKCINCGLCERICPHINKNFNIEESRSYLFLCSDFNNYISSSSGGAVSTLYRKYANDNLNFVGVAYDDHMIPFYKVTNKESDIEAFKGSKYIQANPKNVLKEIENLLLISKKVLFVGLPCMVSGLLNYLNFKRVDIQNLYTIDLICHGIGSPSIWESYLAYLEKRFKSKVKDFKFRVKQTNNVIAENGTTHHCSLSFENGKMLLDNSIFTHLYQNIYFKQLMMSDACYDCKYASLERVSDLSVGDSSRYKPSAKQNNNFSHSSFLLVNTKKGRELLNILKNYGDVIEINIDEVHQPHLVSPIQKPTKYNVFWSTYKKYGFSYSACFYGGKNLISYIKNLIK